MRRTLWRSLCPYANKSSQVVAGIWLIRSPAADRAALTCCLSRTHAGGAQASAVMAGAGLYLALVELAFLDDGHQVVRVLQQGDVGKRIAVDDEQVGPLSGFDGSGLGPDAA
jgi:hypothetical protein